MSITHTNRKGAVYLLHVGKTKTGKPKYHFSSSAEGNLVNTIPDGYEVFENVHSQVFLVKKDENPIPKAEADAVTRQIKKLKDARLYKTEARKGAVTIYEFSVDSDNLTAILGKFGLPVLEAEQKLFDNIGNYMPILRFILVDDNTRTYETQRYCFKGSIDDWIDLDEGVGTIDKLAAKFVKHLGKESFFDLM